MTKEEFQSWLAETKKSEKVWVKDRVHDENGSTLLYKGGVDGVFIWIEADGLAMIGRYEAAYPHIGEACFRVLHRKKFETKEEAVSVVFPKLGVEFLLNMFRII